MGSIQQWYEAMPDLYRAELDTLRHGLSYFKFANQEPFEQTGGQLIVFGQLTYAANTIQLVRIVFPYSYPYSPPEFYPVQPVMQVVGNQVQQKLVQKDFNRGNQYGDGRLCLFRDEEEWIPFYNSIGMAVEQARNWLQTATSKEGFTQNLVVEENNPVIEPKGQLLYYLSDKFPSADEGRLLCKLFKEGYYSLLQLHCNTNSGTQVIDTFPDDTVLSLSTKEIIHGKWFRVMDATPITFLPTVIQTQGLANFLLLQFKINLTDLLPEPEIIAKRTIIGFLIGNASELHCFQIFYWKEGINIQAQSTYLLPKNLYKELYVRIDALFSLTSLFQKRILVVGSGSIGSEVKKELAASNIGFYTVIDDEKFDAGNSVRHAGDLLNVGELKVDIAKRIIQGRNPQASVQKVPVNVLRLPLDLLYGLIENADVVLDLTANRLVEEYLYQKVCIEKGKTLIQAAVSKGGLTGIILIFKPGESACLNCLRSKKLNQVPISLLDVNSLKETPPDYGACSKPALPASGMDTREVAIQTARVVLQFLMRDEDVFYPKLRGFQYYWHGPAGAISNTDGLKHKPFEWEIQQFHASETCESCKLKQ